MGHSTVRKCGCTDGWVTLQVGDGIGMGTGALPPDQSSPRRTLPEAFLYLHLASFQRGFEAVTPPQSLIPRRYHLPPLNHRSLELPLIKPAGKCAMPARGEHTLILASPGDLKAFLGGVIP